MNISTPLTALTQSMIFQLSCLVGYMIVPWSVKLSTFGRATRIKASDWFPYQMQQGMDDHEVTRHVQRKTQSLCKQPFISK